MSDERNADSVLFKLDTLNDVQTAQASQQPGAQGQIARLAAAAPASGGSGLIDVKTLAASAGPETAPAEAEVSASSPSQSGGAALSDSLLSSSSMLAATPEATPASVPIKAPSRVPLIILSVLAVLALGAAITAIVIRG